MLQQSAPGVVIEPPESILLPVLAANSYTTDEDLRDMFATLVAAAMDPETAGLAHPSFADIIRQLTPDEARIVKGLAIRGRTWPAAQVVTREVKVERIGDRARPWGAVGDPERYVQGVRWHNELSLNDTSARHGALYLESLERHGLVRWRVWPLGTTMQGGSELSIDATERGRPPRKGKDSHMTGVRLIEVTLTASGQQFARACVPRSPDDADAYPTLAHRGELAPNEEIVDGTS
jgi:hypothetical protein